VAHACSPNTGEAEAVAGAGAGAGAGAAAGQRCRGGENEKFKLILSYKTNWKSAWATRDSQKKQKQSKQTTTKTLATWVF